ncbi:MAG TPA: Mrp/NBP35 family ATP-binding protein [Actinomycetota bacterium]|nr:Mrp/NBP35 family ATP-binding protein [Actinomycetota bacterium]
MPTNEQIQQALSTVADPEIGKPITELDMVKNVTVDGSNVIVEIYLTIAGCPLKDRITREVTAAVKAVPGVQHVEVVLDVMSEQQRQAMVERLRAGRPSVEERPIAFWQPGTKTRAILVASGKGGVGKSSVTANLGIALSKLGYKVGIVDCDIYGFSIHRVMGVSGRPTVIEDMALPLEAHGVKVMSMGFLVPDDQAIIWRGPMLHKVVQQFLGHAYWGDVDFMLMDLPPGTGDVPLSIAQLLSGAEMVVVTTPQEAAQKVAVRAGKMTEQVPLKIIGVIENMSYFICPDCNEKHLIFGEGGGNELATALDTKLLGQIPMDTRLRQGSDEGKPIVVTDPDSPASLAITEIAAAIAKTGQSLVGKSLPVMMTTSGGARGGHEGHSH